MKRALLLSSLVLTTLLLAGCAPSPSDEATVDGSSLTAKPSATPCAVQPIADMASASATLTKEQISKTAIVIQTCKGNIGLELYPADAPKTVKNFVSHVDDTYYDGLTFHRVEPGFVIQGGDPNGNGSGGVSIYGETFEDELNPNTASYKAGYKEGVLAMANRGPNTNGSQFFIMLADDTSLPKQYTIFGKVTYGMDVVKKITKGDQMIKLVHITSGKTTK